MTEFSARAGPFPPFSDVHEAGESATYPQKDAEANGSVVPDGRDACERTVDRPILRLPKNRSATVCGRPMTACVG